MRAHRWFFFALFALQACDHRNRATEERPRTLSAPANDEAEALALAGTAGKTALDRRIARLIALAKARPQRLATWIELGRSYVDKARTASDPGFYLNADACAERGLRIAPEDPLALDLRALVLLNGHRFEAAKALSESLLAKHPDSVMAWGSLSDALLELGEHDAAERAATTMLDLKPSLPSYSRMSYLRWLRGADADARELARLAIDASDDPRRPEPRAWMLVQAAMLFWHAGDWRGADAGFRKALDVVKDYPPALVGRGRVKLAEGDASAAALLFEKAWSSSPLAETAWLLGEARELAGNTVAATEAYAAAEREGRRSDPRTLALMFASQNRNTNEAVLLAERERKVRADIYTEDALAFALYRVGRFDEARSAIERARRFATPDARLIFHEGVIRLALGQKSNGRRLLERALRLNAHFDERGAREAAALLGRSS
jgi:tetratricopeptide (TPR) repeat protein